MLDCVIFLNSHRAMSPPKSKKNKFDLNAPANLEPRIAARQLYWQGWRITDIARTLGLNPNNVYSWKTRENWDGGSPMQRVATSAEVRLHALINQPKKSDADYKEMRQLSDLINGYPNARRKENRQPEHLDTPPFDDYPIPTIDSPPREQKEKREKSRNNSKKDYNFFTPEQIADVQRIFHEQMFDYQRHWYNQNVRFRNLLKSRQIGATFFFAREALVNALISGKNKIFLSASKAQAFQFKQYQIDLAEMVGVELRGENIRLNNGATLYYLGTNSKTAQGRHGDLYVDEYFWIPDFKELSRVAKPMASQKQYRITYFSTPSSTSHPAYPFWSGEMFNDGREKLQHIQLDISHNALKNGRLCEDGQWRQIVTLDDAEKGGCTLFDREQLLLENSPAEFRQLFMCEFIENGDSVFSFNDLQKCSVDSWEEWADFYKPFAPKPAGEAPVWIGYDPSDTGDNAALVAVLAPRFQGDKFRIVEHHTLHGNDFQAQADFIKKMLARFNVKKIVIDKTGLGAAVFQLVQKFYPMAIGIQYTLPEKALMINKMHALIREKRVEWELNSKDITAAFLNIRTFATASGRNITYASNRTKESSHSDVAWAALQVFYQEPLDGNISGGGSVDIY